MRTSWWGSGLVRLGGLVAFLVGASGCETRDRSGIWETDDPAETAPAAGAPVCPSTDARCASLPSATPSDPATLAFAPVDNVVGSFRGRLTLETPTGGTIELPVEAHGKAGAASGDWDLYFFDATRTLSASGVLGLRGGAETWLAESGSGYTLRAEVVSLDRGALGSPGWKVERHSRTGALRGDAWLRIPSPGADLPPLHYSFTLDPVVDTSCVLGGPCATGTCDAVSGFCSDRPFVPGTFQVSLELVAQHEGLAAWARAPRVPDLVPLEAVWCASPALGFAGSWTFPTQAMSTRPVMTRSGDLLCMDPGGVPAARGPIPLYNRADLEAFGLVDRMSADSLFATCWSELGRRPEASPREPSETDAFSAWSGGFLDFAPECISLGHVAAVQERALAIASSPDSAPDDAATARRVLTRLLQQWVQVHGFLLRQGLDLNSHERALLGDAATARPLTDLLDRAGSGWALIANVLGSSGGTALVEARDPDYRRSLKFSRCDDGASCSDPALRCQTDGEACGPAGCGARACVMRETGGTLDDQATGLGPTLLDGLEDELRVLEAWLATPAARGPQANERFGHVMRRALLVEGLAAKLRARADVCGAAECAPPRWIGRWQDSLSQLNETRTRSYTAALGLGP